MSDSLTPGAMRLLAEKKHRDCLEAKTLDLSNSCALEFTLWTIAAEVCERLEEILVRMGKASGEVGCQTDVNAHADHHSNLEAPRVPAYMSGYDAPRAAPPSARGSSQGEQEGRRDG